MKPTYVHGYQATESERLNDQARTLEDLLHEGTHFAAGARVLEVGCGVGAQTVALARRSPQAHITAVDISAASLQQARARVAAAGLHNVAFECVDLWQIKPAAGPAADGQAAAGYDHLFVCFVLEHLPDPLAALVHLRRLLRPGGTLTLIEGDHGSVMFHPEGAAARAAIACQVELQRRAGGDALIGRRLYPLLQAAGWHHTTVRPCFVYADASRPQWVEGFTRKTFAAMIEGVRAPALSAGLMSAADFDLGLAQLRRTAEADGVFCYTFFKAVAAA